MNVIYKSIHGVSTFLKYFIFLILVIIVQYICIMFIVIIKIHFGDLNYLLKFVAYTMKMPTIHIASYMLVGLERIVYMWELEKNFSHIHAAMAH
jgi:hypothetical protein